MVFCAHFSYIVNCPIRPRIPAHLVQNRNFLRQNQFQSLARRGFLKVNYRQSPPARLSHLQVETSPPVPQASAPLEVQNCLIRFLSESGGFVPQKVLEVGRHQLVFVAIDHPAAGEVLALGALL